MTHRAGLLLRVDRMDGELELLRTALGRALTVHPEAKFSSVFVGGHPAVSAKAAARLRSDLQGSLCADVEVTLHAVAGSDDVAMALGAGRRSLPLSPGGGRWPAGALALDLGPRTLAAVDHLKRVRLLSELGVVHLALGLGPGTALDDLRRWDEAARAHGFQHYEAANWARPGYQARWLLHARNGGPILGLGPGAYGRWPRGSRWRWWRSPSGRRWRDAVLAGADGRGRPHPLTSQERATERLIDGLRLADGVDLASIETETNLARKEWLSAEGLESAVADGSVRQESHRLIATDLLRCDLLAELLLVRTSMPPTRA